MSNTTFPISELLKIDNLKAELYFVPRSNYEFKLSLNSDNSMGSLKKETTIKLLMIKIVLISILTFPNSIIFSS